jgi:pimeloyl-ACP methyl ester carboxylesterase
MPSLVRTLPKIAALLALAAAFAPRSFAALPEPKFVTVQGNRIQYYDLGQGDPIVLVHGMASAAQFDWLRVMEPLAKNHRVIALDQIGFGASDKPAGPYRIQTWVDSLGAFLTQLKVDRFTLAGESLGGWIVAQYTTQALTPGSKLPRPVRLILSDAAGIQWKVAAPATESKDGTPKPTEVWGGTKENLRAGLGTVFFDKSAITDDLLDRELARRNTTRDAPTVKSFSTNPDAQKEVMDAARLQSIKIPTLLVWGEKDQIVPLANGKAYAAGIPGAKLVVIPQCGHVPALEKPAEFLAAVTAFLH